MKRQLSQTTAAPRKRRQDPVSCSLCRNKKLKCDRMFPCSNCRTRGINCVSALADEDSGPQSTVPPTTFEKQYSPPTTSSFNEFSLRFNPAPASTTFETPREELSNKTAIWLENTAVGHEVVEKSANENSSVHVPTLSIVDTLFPFTAKTGPFALVDSSDLLAILPSRAQALRLLDHYADKVAWIDHLLHTPTLHDYLARTYGDTKQISPPTIGQLSLLCTVLGKSAYFWTPALQISEGHAALLAKQLLDLAQRALLAAKFAEQPTLETIQAALLVMYYLLPNIRGSVDTPVLLLTAANWARKLNIHRVDSQKEQLRREKDGCDFVEVELKRRIWWFIVSYDWIMSDMLGPSCGTYIFQRHHMQVNRPSNADDLSIDRTGAYSRPYSAPTEMTYALWRIEMSEKMRDITDACAEASVARDDLDYDTVLSLDVKYNKIIAEMPFFFRLDPESVKRADSIRRARPYMAWQAQMCEMGVNSRLSQLHRPYLARGYEDPRYATSRDVCLRSARMAISVIENMRNLSPNCSPKLLRMWTIMHHLFVSIVVLAMEYGFNGKDPKVKGEIIRACAILERSQADSIIARRGVQQLKTVLDGWKSRVEKPVEELNVVTGQASAESTQPSDTNPLQFNLESFEPYNNEMDPDFSWFDFSAPVGATEWEELFKDLNMPPAEE